MARLPNPGSDNDTWGDILNDFLGQSLSADGSLKTSAVFSAGAADNTTVVHLSGNESIGGTKTFVTSPIVPTPSLGTQAANKSYVDSTLSGGTTPDADGTTKGKIQLAGDLGGPADSPTVTFANDTLHLLKTGGTLSGALTVTPNATAILIGDGTNTNVYMAAANGRSWFGYDTTGYAFMQGTTTKGLKFNVNSSTPTAGTVATVDTTGNWGYLTPTPTHTLTLGSTATGIALYNTSDQTTNYERGRIYFSGNTMSIRTESGGTGLNRSLVLGTANRTFNIADYSSAYGFYQFTAGTSTANAVQTLFSPSMNSTSGTNAVVAITPSLTQTGTAGYTALLINPTETATGTGTKLLADFQVGGVSKTSIDNSGNHIFHSGAAALAYNTADETTNYEVLKQYWSANTYNIGTNIGGTGSIRPISIYSGSNLVAGINFNYIGNPAKVTVTANTSTANIGGMAVNYTTTASSGISTALQVTPTINGSGTAGYTALLINPTETTTGNGMKLLADFQVGGASKTSIDNAGNHIFHSGAGAYLYNTSDETTNYERIHQYWSGNVFNITTELGGSGSARNILLQSGNTKLTLNYGGPAVEVRRDNSGLNALLSVTSTGLNAVSGNQAGILVTPVVSQTGTAGYTGLQVNITEATTGSGTKLLADFQIGGVSKTSIDSAGNHIIHSGTQGVIAYNTTDETTNYERARQYWSGNLYVISTEAGGTGTQRAMQLSANAAISFYLANVERARIQGSVVTGLLAATGGLSQTASSLGASGTYSGSSSVINGLAIVPGVNQSGTSSYRGIWVSPYEQALGSGANYLIDLGTNTAASGGGTHTSKFSVSNSGLVTASNRVTNVTDPTSPQDAATKNYVDTVTSSISAGATLPRANVLTAASNTYTPNSDTTDVAIISGPTANFTLANPTGTAHDGQKLFVRIKNGATGYTPSWGTAYAASGSTFLPASALPASVTNSFGFMYDASAGKWVLLSLDITGY